jgi:hypothetical protein
MHVSDLTDAAPRLVHAASGRRLWVMDSIAFGSDDMAGDLIVTGSHGGTSAGEYARSYGVSLAVCNDAGRGKNDAGVAGLRDLDHHAIAGLGVSHLSARIGDGEDTWEKGVVSYANQTARRLGLHTGEPIGPQLMTLLERGDR